MRKDILILLIGSGEGLRDLRHCVFYVENTQFFLGFHFSDEKNYVSKG